MNPEPHIHRVKNGGLRYRYEVPGVGRCNFSLLSEVGQRWVQGFQDEIKQRGWVVGTRNVPQPPWCEDYVKREESRDAKN